MKETTNTITRRSRSYCRAASARPINSSAQRNVVLVGDAVTQVRQLPASSIDCVITSPPYFMLRNYDAGPDELGTEPDVEGYVQSLIDICDQLARVLKPSGVMWLNINDSFSKHPRYGAPAKAMLLAPERLLLALSKRGWLLRGKVVWAKSTHMPASVRDRWTNAWEPLFMLTRSPQYFFDLDRVRIPHTSKRQPAMHPPKVKYAGVKPPWAGPLAGANDGLTRYRASGQVGHPLGKNPSDVWTYATAGYRGAHFAVFPERLIERPILACCPERVCVACGSPWRRERRRDRLGQLHPSCDCNADSQPGLVLDPFMGSGTVGVVAKRLHRDWLGIELNPKYAAMATERIGRSSSDVKRDTAEQGEPQSPRAAQQGAPSDAVPDAATPVLPAFDAANAPDDKAKPEEHRQGNERHQQEGDADQSPRDRVEISGGLRVGEEHANRCTEGSDGNHIDRSNEPPCEIEQPLTPGRHRLGLRRRRRSKVIQGDLPSKTAEQRGVANDDSDPHHRDQHGDSVADPGADRPTISIDDSS